MLEFAPGRTHIGFLTIFEKKVSFFVFRRPFRLILSAAPGKPKMGFLRVFGPFFRGRTFWETRGFFEM